MSWTVFTHLKYVTHLTQLRIPHVKLNSAELEQANLTPLPAARRIIFNRITFEGEDEKKNMDAFGRIISFVFPHAEKLILEFSYLKSKV